MKANKKAFLAITSITSLSCIAICGVAIATNNPVKLQMKANSGYTMTLDSNSEFVSEDHGFYNSVTIKNNEFDFIGWTAVDGKLGSIKKQTYNSFEYKGMVYNRSLINGFKSFTVNYSGAELYYTLTNYLMEDMSFDRFRSVTSGEPIEVPNNEGYFIIYNDDYDFGSEIESITIEYDCDASIDAEMIFNRNSTLKSARSTSKSTKLTDSFMVLENNPLSNTNNYSTGSHSGNADTWYRWNGRVFEGSGDMGSEFTLHTTIMGNISQAMDYYENVEDNYFNYSVWPKVKLNGTSDVNWAYVYIGNDNYEPLGKYNPNRVHTNLYGDYSYPGRFITTYRDYGSDGWQFADPSNTYTQDYFGKTYQEAYETYTLPYWYLKFEFRVDGTDLYCDAYVNNFLIDSSVMFEDYQGEGITIDQIHMHCVNYGKTDGSPAASYKGVFTYPRKSA